MTSGFVVVMPMTFTFTNIGLQCIDMSLDPSCAIDGFDTTGHPHGLAACLDPSASPN